MVIVIVGHPASGKDLAAAFFKEHGFAHISSGDIIREDMRAQGIPTDREHMNAFSAKRRRAEGNEYPAKEIAARIAGDTVVSGLRNLAEVEALRKKFAPHFALIAIHAPAEMRYARLGGRNRDGDQISLEQFRAEEERERNAASGTHEVGNVIAAADAAIENTGTKEEFFAKLAEFLKR